MTESAERDRELAKRWQQGEVEAYNELVRIHLDPVHRFIRARCGNEADSADLSQEVFLEVCWKIGNFDPKYPFSAWLYTIARRKTVDFFRRQKPTELFDPEQHSGTEVRHPSRILEDRESACEAWQFIYELLPETQATALWLRVQGQQSIEQIAAAMEQSVANVKVLLFRARQRLAQEWRPTTASFP